MKSESGRQVVKLRLLVMLKVYSNQDKLDFVVVSVHEGRQMAAQRG